MKTLPLVSIIIPTYNRAEIIKTAIDSVIAQSYKNWECLVVDDYSTDRTKEVIEGYRQKENRIKYFPNQREKGAQGARNTGIINSNSDWIAFQDSDDAWLPDKLEKQIKELEKVNFDKNYVIHGNCNIFNHGKNITTYWNLPVVEGGCYKLLLSAPAPVFPAILVSKEALKKINLLDANVPSYQEWDTSIRLAKICKFIHIQEPLFIYHQHLDNTISKNKFEDFKGYDYVISKFEYEIKNLFDSNTWNNHIKRQAYFAIKHNWWNKVETIFQKFIEPYDCEIYNLKILYSWFIEKNIRDFHSFVSQIEQNKKLFHARGKEEEGYINRFYWKCLDKLMEYGAWKEARYFLNKFSNNQRPEWFEYKKCIFFRKKSQEELYNSGIYKFFRFFKSLIPKRRKNENIV